MNHLIHLLLLSILFVQTHGAVTQERRTVIIKTTNATENGNDLRPRIRQTAPSSRFDTIEKVRQVSKEFGEELEKNLAAIAGRHASGVAVTFNGMNTERVPVVLDDDIPFPQSRHCTAFHNERLISSSSLLEEDSENLRPVMRSETKQKVPLSGRYEVNPANKDNEDSVDEEVEKLRREKRFEGLFSGKKKRKNGKNVIRQDVHTGLIDMELEYDPHVVQAVLEGEVLTVVHR